MTRATVAVSVWAVLWAAPEILAQEALPDCQKWNTKDYFTTATVQDVKACLAAGADLRARDKRGQTPLHWAARSNENPEVLQALLTAGADLRARDKRGQTPLHWAARSNENPEVLQALLTAGADLSARNEAGLTPLYTAAMNENPEVFQALLTAGADLSARNEAGLTPLHWAAGFNENPEVLQALLTAGADLSARNEAGLTPLHWAARSNENPEVLQALLAAGADPSARSSSESTPLHYAAWFNENPEVLQALLAAGASLKVRDQAGDTLLHAAADNDNLPAIQFLLKLGLNAKSRNENGKTPLHAWAASYTADDPAVLQALLAAGADLEARDENGNTPLHSASQRSRNRDVTNLAIGGLLDAGADATATNAEVKTPWDLAKTNTVIKGTDVYWRLNEARFEAPRGGRTSPSSGDSRSNAVVPSNEVPCEIPNYPNPGDMANLGLSWCPASVTFQVRTFALQAAGIKCAVAAASPAPPEVVSRARSQMSQVCSSLEALDKRLGEPNGGASCRCPAGYGP